jgi:hypothetical protein
MVEADLEGHGLCFMTDDLKMDCRLFGGARAWLGLNLNLDGD